MQDEKKGEQEVKMTPRNWKKKDFFEDVVRLRATHLLFHCLSLIFFSERNNCWTKLFFL